MSTAATRCAPYGSARRRCAELPYSPSQSGCLTQNAPYEGGQRRMISAQMVGKFARAPLPTISTGTGEFARPTARVPEQAELLGGRARRPELVGGQPRLRLIEAEALARDLETPADHPGVRPRALHAAAPGGVVVLAAAHLADEREHVPVLVGKIRHQPFAEQV